MKYVKSDKVKKKNVEYCDEKSRKMKSFYCNIFLFMIYYVYAINFLIIANKKLNIYQNNLIIYISESKINNLRKAKRI